MLQPLAHIFTSDINEYFCVVLLDDTHQNVLYFPLETERSSVWRPLKKESAVLGN